MLAREKHIPALDGLRGLAIILVLLFHFTPEGGGHTLVGTMTRWISQLGWCGVDLFFVLSGFLISGLLFTEYQKYRALRVGRFLIRRGFKIYPAFYVMLAATVVGTAYNKKLPDGFLLRVLTEAVYLQNYLPPVWGPTWSLAVEEHFYLLLAVAFFVMVRRGSRENPFRSLVYVVGCVAVLALSLRIYTALSYPYSDRRNFFPTHLRLDAIAWGVLLGYLYHFRRATLLAFLERRRALIAACSALLLVPPFVWPLGQSRFLATLGLTFLDWGFAGVLILSFTRPLPLPQPVARALAALGYDSYSIYLWHIPVVAWLMDSLRRHRTLDLHSATLAWGLDMAVYTIASIVLGVVMARAVEGPALMLRDRLFPSRSGSLAASMPAPLGTHVPSGPTPPVPHRPTQARV